MTSLQYSYTNISACIRPQKGILWTRFLDVTRRHGSQSPRGISRVRWINAVRLLLKRALTDTTHIHAFTEASSDLRV